MSILKGYGKQYYQDHFGDYASGGNLEDETMNLYKDQKNVPRLPIPKLKTTLELYYKSIQPLFDKAQLEKTKKLIDNFESGIGPVLHKRLEDRKASLPNTSWLQEPWNKLGYLEYRESVMHNVSFYFLFANEMPTAMNPFRRAARFLYYLIDFRRETVTGTLQPDMIRTKDGKRAMCSTQWKFLFNTARIPASTSDFARTYAPDLFNHFVVIKQNRLFKIEAFDWKTQTSISVDDIERVLNEIDQYCAIKGENQYWVGSMSSDNRAEWYESYEKVKEIKGNEQKLEVIQSAMFLLGFDDVIPSSTETAARYVLHSYANKNRYWDKPIQLNIYNDGRMGFVAEHSMADGTIANRIMNVVYQRMVKDTETFKKVHYQKATSKNSLQGKVWDEIEFELNETVKQRIQRANQRYIEFVSKKEHKLLVFQSFGVNEIKRLKVSPDGFVQVGIQLAYYRSFGECCPTYEPAQARSFLHGRTEAARACTSEALDFSKSMFNSSLSDLERGEKLRNAISHHVAYVRKASSAQGCDRHLLGLKLMLKAGEDDSLFKDPSYSQSSHWTISTSRLDGDGLLSAGFGEVVPDGLGLGYSFKKDYFPVAVSSADAKQRKAEIFLSNLERSFLEMRELLVLTLPSQKAKL